MAGAPLRGRDGSRRSVPLVPIFGEGIRKRSHKSPPHACGNHSSSSSEAVPRQTGPGESGE